MGGLRAQARRQVPYTATGFAKTEGAKGSKTRTWFSVRGEPIFAWGGLWRDSAEWGPVYFGAMTECNEAIRPVHDRMPVLLHRDEYDRMPVLLHRDEYDRWLRGSFDDLVAFQERCFRADLVAMERTSELWVKRKQPVAESLF